MNQLPGLMFYPVGGRGDFLYSILFGDILEHNWQSHTILYPDFGRTVIKIHDFGKIFCSSDSINTPTDLLRYRTVRISAKTISEQKQIARLWNLKHGHNEEHAVLVIQAWEEKYQSCNEFCYKVVEFKNLFDISFVSAMAKEVRQADLTDDQKFRIQYNIGLNIKLLEQ